MNNKQPSQDFDGRASSSTRRDELSASSQSNPANIAAIYEQAQRYYEQQQQLALLSMSDPTTLAAYMQMAYNPYSMLPMNAAAMTASLNLDGLRGYQTQLAEAALQQQLHAANSLLCNPSLFSSMSTAGLSGLAAQYANVMNSAVSETPTAATNTATHSSFNIADILRTSYSPLSSNQQQSPASHSVISSSSTNKPEPAKSSSSKQRANTSSHRKHHTSSDHRKSTHQQRKSSTSTHHKTSTPRRSTEHLKINEELRSLELQRDVDSRIAPKQSNSMNNGIRTEPCLDSETVPDNAVNHGYQSNPESLPNSIEENGLDLSLKSRSEVAAPSSITTSVIRSPVRQNGIRLGSHSPGPGKARPYSPDDGRRTDERKSASQNDVLSNLKRLSQQLTAQQSDSQSKCETNSQPCQPTQKYLVSLLKHNNLSSTNCNTKSKGKQRKGKQKSTTPLQTTNQKQDENQSTNHTFDKSPAKADLPNKTKPLKKRFLAQLQEFAQCTQPKRQRKSKKEDSKPKPRKPKVTDRPRRKRISKPKPSSNIHDIPDLQSFSLPFLYGWRRETQISTSTDHSHPSAEVIYVSPSNEVMKTYEDVETYLHHLEASQLSMISKVQENGLPTTNSLSDQSDVLKSESPHQSDLSITQTDQSDVPKAILAPSSGMKPFMPEHKALSKQHFSFSLDVKLGEFIEHTADGHRIKLTSAERDNKLSTSDNSTATSTIRKSRLKLKNHITTNSTSLKRKQTDNDNKKNIKVKKETAKLKRIEMLAQTKAQKAQQLADRMQQFQESKLQKKSEKEQVSVVIEQMKDRQRQHQLNSRLIDVRQREEERHRLLVERRGVRDRKTERKLKENTLLKELKKPQEDLLLPQTKPLPELARITGLRLPGSEFADVLQIHQFITDFYDCLEMTASVPSLNTFQAALYHECERSEDQLKRVLCHMLKFAIKDPGLAKKFINGLQQSLSDVKLDEYSFSEVLRCYIELSTFSGTEVSRALQTIPFWSLPISLKCQGMAWLVEDLLTSQAVQDQVEKNMEEMATLKRDRWETEGKIRELKAFNEKPIEGPKKESDDEKEISAMISHVKDKEVACKLEKLVKQHERICDDVRKCGGALRILPLGSDRYMRLYWFIPMYGCILVESLASSVDQHQDKTHVEFASKPLECSKTPPKKLKVNSENMCNPVGKLTQSPDLMKDFKPDLSEPETPSSMQTSKNIESKDGIIKLKTENLSGHIDVLQASNRDLKNPSVVRNGELMKSSISSWLSSTIDTIFSGVQAQPSTSLSTDMQSKPGRNWIQLDRKVSCKSVSMCPPQVVRNTLMFWNKDLDYEDRATIDSVTRLLAEGQLLPKAQQIPYDTQSGWWIITDYEQVKELQSKLHQRGVREKHLLYSLNKHSKYIERVLSSSEGAVPTDLKFAEGLSNEERDLSSKDQSYDYKACRSVELNVLDRVEELEDRVYQASMYTQIWADKKKQDQTDLDLVVTPQKDVMETQTRILSLISEKLANLQTGIERRYLKPPFGKRPEVSLTEISAVAEKAEKSTDKPTNQEGEENSESEDEIDEQSENGSKEVKKWKMALEKATSVSQLYISLLQLGPCIAWEKSVMRVLCQICRSDDNEDQLLLCDGCDKGYHTYCFRPEMKDIPEGDWYCWECRSKATSISYCIRCGDTQGKIAICHKCPQAIHIACLTPPLQRLPKKFTCGHCLGVCNSLTQKKSRQRQQKSLESIDSGQNSESEEEEPEQEDQSQSLNTCRLILEDMLSLKEASAFKDPVNTKTFPEYKIYIKKPMDLSTIEKKLDGSLYSHRTEFHADMILIFDNCLLFNEDNSEIGKSGKAMRRHFLKKWKTAFPS